MTKSELITIVSDKVGCDRFFADGVISVMFDVIADTLASGEEVKLSGFGTLYPAIINGHEIKDIQTKERIRTHKRGIVKFRLSKYLKAKCMKHMDNWDLTKNKNTTDEEGED